MVALTATEMRALERPVLELLGGGGQPLTVEKAVENGTQGTQDSGKAARVKTPRVKAPKGTQDKGPRTQGKYGGKCVVCGDGYVSTMPNCRTCRRLECKREAYKRAKAEKEGNGPQGTQDAGKAAREKRIAALAARIQGGRSAGDVLERQVAP